MVYEKHYLKRSDKIGKKKIHFVENRTDLTQNIVEMWYFLVT
jgi:hypothetical protein